MNIIAISASIKDLQALNSFFAQAECVLPDTIYVVVLPDAIGSEWQKNVQGLQVHSSIQVVDANLNLQIPLMAHRIYLVPLWSPCCFKDGILTRICSDIRESEKGASVKTFWHSLSHFNQGSVVAIAFRAAPMYSDGIEEVKQSGGLILLSQSNANAEVVHLYSGFDYILLPEAMPSLIAQHGLFSRSAEVQKLYEKLNLLVSETQAQGVALLDINRQLRKSFEQSNNALKEAKRQKELLLSVLTNMNEGILLIDKEGKVFLLNRAATQMTKSLKVGDSLATWAEQYLSYLPDGEVLIPEGQNPFSTILKGEEIDNIDIYVVKKGETQGVHWNINVRRLETSDIGGFATVVVLTDITQRKRSEVELQQSEMRQKALLFAVPDLLFRVDEKGTYLDYLPPKDGSYCPPAFFVDNTMSDVLPNEIIGEVNELLQKALQSNTVQSFSFQYDDDDIIRFQELRLSAIGNGEALGLLRDITDVISGRDAIEQSELHYTNLLNKCPACVALITKNGKFRLLNPSARKCLGIDEAADVTQKNVRDFIHLKDILRAETGIARAFEGQQSTNPLSFRLITTTNKIRYIQLNGGIINCGGQLVLQVIAQDVTKLKKIIRQNRR